MNDIDKLDDRIAILTRRVGTLEDKAKAFMGDIERLKNGKIDKFVHVWDSKPPVHIFHSDDNTVSITKARLAKLEAIEKAAVPLCVRVGKLPIGTINSKDGNEASGYSLWSALDDALGKPRE